MAIKKLKRHNSRGVDEIPAGFTKAGGRQIRSEINKLINSIWKKEQFSEEWKNSIILPIYKKSDKTYVVIIQAYRFCQICTKFYPTSCCQF
jgi:hypothetical protein